MTLFTVKRFSLWSLFRNLLIISALVFAGLIIYSVYQYNVAVKTWPRTYQKIPAGEVLKYEDKLWTCITAVNGSYFQSQYVSLEGYKLLEEIIIPDFAMKVTHVYTCTK